MLQSHLDWRMQRSSGKVRAKLINLLDSSSIPCLRICPTCAPQAPHNRAYYKTNEEADTNYSTELLKELVIPEAAVRIESQDEYITHHILIRQWSRSYSRCPTSRGFEQSKKGLAPLLSSNIGNIYPHKYACSSSLSIVS